MLLMMMMLTRRRLLMHALLPWARHGGVRRDVFLGMQLRGVVGGYTEPGVFKELLVGARVAPGVHPQQSVCEGSIELGGLSGARKAWSLFLVGGTGIVPSGPRVAASAAETRRGAALRPVVVRAAVRAVSVAHRKLSACALALGATR